MKKPNTKFKMLTDTPKPKAKQQPRRKNIRATANLVPLSLSVVVSERFEGIADNLLGLIDGFPIEMKMFFNNAKIKKTIVNSSHSLFVLDNGYTVKFTDMVHARKNSVEIIIKQKKKIILNKILPYNEVHKRPSGNARRPR